MAIVPGSLYYGEPIGGMMKRNLTLTISAMLTLVLTSLHFADDVLHDTRGVDTMGSIILLSIMLVYLYAIVELSGRRSGYVMMLIGGLAAAYMPFLHTLGPRATRWGFEFIWVMMAMAVIGLFSSVLAGRELWRSARPSSRA